MAQIIRSAKSGSDCGTSELLAFDIRVEEKTNARFFGQPLPADVNISSVIFSHLDEPQNATKSESDLFAYLEDAMTITPDEESFITDFVVQILKLMGFDASRRGRFLSRCADRKWARRRMSALWREDQVEIFFSLFKKTGNHRGVLLQQQSQATKRSTALIQVKAIIPGITTVGSAPVFYKFPVTQELLTAIITAQYPQDAVVVERLFPPVNNWAAYASEGMKPLNNRLLVLLKHVDNFSLRSYSSSL
ncbi:hypothetical protein FIBSPDRAFT_1038598 [Athelia psychrophila]|uniref:Uncharacterized protein n=1 Tax=Athelia psychrophila TaxID=1759441 RepID=A0A166SV94_9AGAM|nr:hypothetical protein FIBSPDRAFT_1038598 [Fibularhizoctonia sp. CBS 109695]